MAITVASVLNAKGKRSDVAKLLGLKRTSLNQWVSMGSIPAKFFFALMKGNEFRIADPEFRKIFGFVEPKE